MMRTEAGDQVGLTVEHGLDVVEHAVVEIRAVEDGLGVVVLLSVLSHPTGDHVGMNNARGTIGLLALPCSWLPPQHQNPC